MSGYWSVSARCRELVAALTASLMDLAARRWLASMRRPTPSSEVRCWCSCFLRAALAAPRDRTVTRATLPFALSRSSRSGSSVHVGVRTGSYAAIYASGSRPTASHAVVRTRTGQPSAISVEAVLLLFRFEVAPRLTTPFARPLRCASPAGGAHTLPPSPTAGGAARRACAPPPPPLAAWPLCRRGP